METFNTKNADAYTPNQKSIIETNKKNTVEKHYICGNKTTTDSREFVLVVSILMKILNEPCILVTISCKLSKHKM